MILLLFYSLAAQAGDFETCQYKTYQVDKCNVCIVSQCGDEIQGVICTDSFCPLDTDIGDEVFANENNSEN